jgi:hypothetical protein
MRIWNIIHGLFYPFNTRPEVIRLYIYQANDTLQNWLVQAWKGMIEQWTMKGENKFQGFPSFFAFAWFLSRK